MSSKLSRYKRDFENIDVIIDSGGKAYNLTVLDQFLISVKAKFPSSVRVLAHNVEGQPILKHLFFDGHKITLIIDLTKQDQLPQEPISVYYGNRIVDESFGSLIGYKLYDNDKYITDILTIDKKLRKRDK